MFASMVDSFLRLGCDLRKPFSRSMTGAVRPRSVGCVNDERSLMSSRWSYVLFATALVAGAFEFVNAFVIEVPVAAVLFGVLYVVGAVWLARTSGLGACVLLGVEPRGARVHARVYVEYHVGCGGSGLVCRRLGGWACRVYCGRTRAAVAAAPVGGAAFSMTPRARMDK